MLDLEAEYLVILEYYYLMMPLGILRQKFDFGRVELFRKRSQGSECTYFLAKRTKDYKNKGFKVTWSAHKPSIKLWLAQVKSSMAKAQSRAGRPFTLFPFWPLFHMFQKLPTSFSLSIKFFFSFFSFLFSLKLPFFIATTSLTQHFIKLAENTPNYG